jgi:hypothetical protein
MSIVASALSGVIRLDDAIGMDPLRIARLHSYSSLMCVCADSNGTLPII